MTRNTDPMLDCVASEETTSPGKLCSRCRELPFGKLQKLRHPPPSLPLHPALYLSDLSSLVDLRFGVRVTALRSQYTRQPTYVSSLHTYPDESSRIACVCVCVCICGVTRATRKHGFGQYCFPYLFVRERPDESRTPRRGRDEETIFREPVPRSKRPSSS